MKRIRVSSSNIAAVGHDSKTQTLEVEFKDGNTYHYFNVPEIVYKGLVNARSVGQYLNEEIKEKYQHKKI